MGQQNNCRRNLAEIGGYFELDLPCFPDLLPDAMHFQSGRAAIRAVIENAGINKIWLPSYVCNSVIHAVTDSGATMEFYALDETLSPHGLPYDLPQHGAILYIDYFGLCRNNVDRLLAEYPGEQLIIDNSQALFASHREVLATVYSPRKFAGIPDGGLLRTLATHRPAEPTEEDTGSIERMRSLLLRVAYPAREGYADFQKIGVSLKNTQPLRMSRLTQRLLKSIQWEQVAQRRRENFLELARKLDAVNDIQWQLGEHDVPMCYPLMKRNHDIGKIRSTLADRDVFVPVYWQDAVPRIQQGTIEATLINQTLFLPIDQRMGVHQSAELGDIILALCSAD
jgi:hypothetical protein